MRRRSQRLNPSGVSVRSSGSNVLAELAFTGYGSSVRTFLLSSPEFTTNGMLRKCWRRIGGKVYLYKGGTEGAANTGNEPYSEFYAAQIAAAMGIHAIPYGLSRWKGVLCSTCELFTDKAYAYLPIGHLVSKGGMGAVRAYYEKMVFVRLSTITPKFPKCRSTLQNTASNTSISFSA